MASHALTAGEVAAAYARYGALLLHRSRLILRDPTLAEDALHDLSMTLLHRGAALREAAAPYRWLCRAMDRACLSLLRRRTHVTASLSLDEVDVLPDAPGLDLEARRAVLEALASLHEDDQAIALAAFVDGATQGEIAHELCLSRVTVNKRLKRIRACLRLRLEAPDSLTDSP